MSGLAFPQSGGAALERAKAADLVTLPKGVKGTNCANCRFVDGDTCTNPKVRQRLKDGAARMCCALWDAVGTKRAWKKST
jgi:hypothetical protein